MSQRTAEYQQLLEDVPCNICGRNNFKIIYPAQYDLAKTDKIHEGFRSSGDETLIDQMVECNYCGLQYLTPRLRQDIIIEAYSSGSDEGFISQAKGRERTFAKSLKSIEKYVPPSKILDVGTAGGSFLKAAKDRGWNVSGCEPNRWLAEWGKKNYGIDIHSGTIFDMELDHDSFNVVTLWDVLEHVPDPQKVLKECSRVLKDNGLLLINYPDINSLVARMMGKKWVFLLSVHLYYFTPKTITKLLEKCGYEVVKITKHWQTLELDYILFRMKPYIPFIPELFRRFFKLINCGHLLIPYWMGQTLVLARKI
ncbi:MAG: class I SAM-dependent methyltransferase [Candidatus Omnitrophica bacterium]|nr:class I SAM-dependent methyltransferase [Candidatus Omnitrophota bacterium]MCB9748179.1 class I SAM-dependent methyltransferase [Candidatus Omnitrophota bacterium]